MTKQLDTPAAKKRRDAAVRRMHRRIASEEHRKHGTPKSVTMKFLNRSRAATMGNKARHARRRQYQREQALMYPAPPGEAYMHQGIRARIVAMSYHERMERARLGMVDTLMTYRLSSNFTDDTFPIWQQRTLRALCYQRGKYRKLSQHTEAQARAHVLLELVIDFIRQSSPALLRKWLHQRQVAEREQEQARRELHNPTLPRRI